MIVTIICMIATAWLTMGLTLQVIFFRDDEEEGIQASWIARLLAIVLWPLLMNFSFSQWLDNMGRRHAATHASGTKYNFGPGDYESEKWNRKETYNPLDDPNDVLDNAGYYDDRHFAKAALERKKD